MYFLSYRKVAYNITSNNAYLPHSTHCARLAIDSWRRLVSGAAAALGISCAYHAHMHTYKQIGLLLRAWPHKPTLARSVGGWARLFALALCLRSPLTTHCRCCCCCCLGCCCCCLAAFVLFGNWH